MVYLCRWWIICSVSSLQFVMGTYHFLLFLLYYTSFTAKQATKLVRPHDKNADNCLILGSHGHLNLLHAKREKPVDKIVHFLLINSFIRGEE